MSRTLTAPTTTDTSPPVPVEIIRPRLDGPAVIARWITAVLNVLMRAWLVQVAARHFGHHLGYWEAALLAVTVRALVAGDEGYLFWTRQRSTR